MVIFVIWVTGNTIFLPEYVKLKQEADRHVHVGERELTVVFYGLSLRNFQDTLYLWGQFERNFLLYDSVDFKVGATLGDSSLFIARFYGNNQMRVYDGKSHSDRFVITGE